MFNVHLYIHLMCFIKVMCYVIDRNSSVLYTLYFGNVYEKMKSSNAIVHIELMINTLILSQINLNVVGDCSLWMQ